MSGVKHSMITDTFKAHLTNYILQDRLEVEYLVRNIIEKEQGLKVLIKLLDKDPMLII